MRAEALVLVRDQHIEITPVDILGTHRQAPTPIRGRKRPQQAILAIDHRRRERELFAKWGRSKRPNPRREADADGAGYREKAEHRTPKHLPRRVFLHSQVTAHRAAVTSTLPVPVRP